MATASPNAREKRAAGEVEASPGGGKPGGANLPSNPPNAPEEQATGRIGGRLAAEALQSAPPKAPEKRASEGVGCVAGAKHEEEELKLREGVEDELFEAGGGECWHAAFGL